MAQATNGSEVTVHYTGTFDDGTVFDSSADREPITFTIGEGDVIPGFESAVVGMAEGDKKTVIVPPEEAYGPRIEEMVIQSPISELPVDDPEEGMVFQASVQGQTVYFVVAGIDDETVTLDGNHPMAGKQLNFELELIKIS